MRIVRAARPSLIRRASSKAASRSTSESARASFRAVEPNSDSRTVRGNRVNNQTSNARSRRREKGPPRCQMDYIMAVRIADRNRKRPAIRTQARCLGGSWAPRRLGVVLLLIHPIALPDQPNHDQEGDSRRLAYCWASPHGPGGIAGSGIRSFPNQQSGTHFFSGFPHQDRRVCAGYRLMIGDGTL
jgi:hypothetical protein